MVSSVVSRPALWILTIALTLALSTVPAAAIAARAPGMERVLIAGGADSSLVLSSAELFDPATGEFSATGSMTTARIYQSATLMRTGSVLVAGGTTDFTSSLSSAEIYNPRSGEFTPTSSMSAPREAPLADVLHNGNVLIVGGYDLTSLDQGTAELYAPSVATFAATGSLPAPYVSDAGAFAATVLRNGNVLISGLASYSASAAFPAAAVYNAATGAFTLTGSPTIGRTEYTATLLNNGKVLLTGGQAVSPGCGSTASAELYDPVSGTFAQTGSLITPRNLHQAVRLYNGKVLITGGQNITCVNGQAVTQALSSAELYDPTTGTFASTGSMIDGRWYHTATLLGNGTVLVAGGSGASGSLSSAELYRPASGTFASTGSMITARFAHTATLVQVLSR